MLNHSNPWITSRKIEQNTTPTKLVNTQLHNHTPKIGVLAKYHKSEINYINCAFSHQNIDNQNNLQYPLRIETSIVKYKIVQNPKTKKIWKSPNSDIQTYIL